MNDERPSVDATESDAPPARAPGPGASEQTPAGADPHDDTTAEATEPVSPADAVSVSSSTVQLTAEPSAPSSNASDPSTPAPNAPAQSLPTPARRRWSLTAKVITWTISIVGFVTGILGVVPNVVRWVAGVPDPIVAVEPYPATNSDWAVPLTADFTDFPPGIDATCSDEQRRWLEEHGTPVTVRVIVDMRNDADEGAMITLKNFRVEGERRAEPARSIRVACDTTAPGKVRTRAARLEAESDRSVAVLSATDYGSSTTDGLPDTPVAWNLAPGESGQLIIQLSAPDAVDGHLFATVLVADKSRPKQLGDSSITLRPLFDDGLTYLRVGVGLACVRDTVAASIASDPDCGVSLDARPSY